MRGLGVVLLGASVHFYRCSLVSPLGQDLCWVWGWWWTRQVHGARCLMERGDDSTLEADQLGVNLALPFTSFWP